MKKRTLFLLVLLLGGAKLLAQQRINLVVAIVDPSSTHVGNPKQPLRIPVVEQDGSQLILEARHAEFTLELIQDGEVVYSVFVPATATVVNLPSWIVGNCEIRLVTGGAYYFYGYLTL